MNNTGLIIGLILLGLTALLVFIALPFAAVIEARCLEQGFPKSAITWKMEGYCLGYDGVVHPIVVPAQK